MHHIDDLANVASTRTLNEVVQGFVANGQLLVLGDKFDPAHDLLWLWHLEFEVVAVGHQSLKLLALSVVANANDGCFGEFDYLNQSCNAAAVTGSAPVDFVHYNHTLLGLLRVWKLVDQVSLPVVKRLVAGKGANEALDGTLVSLVTRVKFLSLIAQCFANDSAGGTLTNPWWSTHHSCSRVDSWNVLPVSGELNLDIFLVSIDDHVVPVPQPYEQLVDGAFVAHQVFDGVRLVQVSPHISVHQLLAILAYCQTLPQLHRFVLIFTQHFEDGVS